MIQLLRDNPSWLDEPDRHTDTHRGPLLPVGLWHVWGAGVATRALEFLLNSLVLYYHGDQVDHLSLGGVQLRNLALISVDHLVLQTNETKITQKLA